MQIAILFEQYKQLDNERFVCIFLYALERDAPLHTELHSQPDTYRMSITNSLSLYFCEIFALYILMYCIPINH